jgi:hypothetical protein
MIISMKLHATRQEIDEVRKQVEHFGYKVHSIEGEERVVIGVVGVGDVTACMESIEAMPQVDKVVRISAPYKFVSKEFRPGKTRIKVNGTEIGGGEFVVMAGPCSVESEKQIMQAAEGVAKAGAKMLRGGAFKPRTSPYDFQGIEAATKGQAGDGAGDYHGSDERPRRGFDREIRGCDASGRAEHAEFHAAKSAGEMRATGAVEARIEQHSERIVDVRRIHHGARKSRGDFVRERHSNVRNGDAEYLRHCGDSRAE